MKKEKSRRCGCSPLMENFILEILFTRPYVLLTQLCPSARGCYFTCSVSQLRPIIKNVIRFYSGSVLSVSSRLYTGVSWANKYPYFINCVWNNTCFIRMFSYLHEIKNCALTCFLWPPFKVCGLVVEPIWFRHFHKLFVQFTQKNTFEIKPNKYQQCVVIVLTEMKTNFIEAKRRREWIWTYIETSSLETKERPSV